MGDPIKGIFIIIVFVLLISQVSAAYTPDLQTIMDGMNLSHQLGIAYDKAIRGQNVAEFNNLVDIYNAWIRQHLGEGANALLKSKITVTNLPMQQVMTEYPYLTQTTYLTKNPFNASSDLSKFGKQQVFRELLPIERQRIESAASDRDLINFISRD